MNHAKFDPDAVRDVPGVMPGATFVDLESTFHEYPTLLDGSRLIKPEALARLPQPVAIKWWRKGRAWGLETGADSAVEAYNLGKRVQKHLVAKRTLTSSDPYLHDLDLYATYSEGLVKIAPDAMHALKVRDTSKQDARHRLQNKGEAVFGSRGFRLSGSDGDYKMEIIPYAKEWRGKFATSAVRGATWEDLDRRLDEVLVKLGVA